MPEDPVPEFLRRMLGMGHAAPVSTNPEDYPRKAKITDDQCLMSIEKQNMIGEDYRKLYDQAVALAEKMEVLDARLRAEKAELFYRLKEVHSDVPKDGNHGWRKHLGNDGNVEYYYVSWDNQPQHQQQ